MSWEIGGGKRWNPGLHDYISISITSLEITDVALEQVAWPVYKDQDWQKQNTHASHAYTHRHAHTRGKGIYTRIYKHTHQHKLKQMYISTLVHITTLICRDILFCHTALEICVNGSLWWVSDCFFFTGAKRTCGAKRATWSTWAAGKKITIHQSYVIASLHAQHGTIIRLWNKTLCFTFREFKALMVFKGQRATWWVCYEIFFACITQYLQTK